MKATRKKILLVKELLHRLEFNDSEQICQWLRDLKKEVGTNLDSFSDRSVAELQRKIGTILDQTPKLNLLSHPSPFLLPLLLLLIIP